MKYSRATPRVFIRRDVAVGLILELRMGFRRGVHIGARASVHRIVGYPVQIPIHS